MRQFAKVVHVELGAVHHESTLADLNPTRARVEVDAFIEVDALREANLVSKADAHILLNGDDAIHVHNQPVGQSP
jgi:hypothetical protein